MTGVVALGSFTATGMCMPPSTIRPVQFREPAEIRPLGPMVSWFCPGFGDRSTTPLMMTPPTGWRVAKSKKSPLIATTHPPQIPVTGAIEVTDRFACAGRTMK